MPTPPEDEFTELVDASIGRVDLVDKAANGLQFLMAKSADEQPVGLMPADFVRDLIGKTADPTPPTADTGDVQVVLTVNGGSWSPDDMARLIDRAVARQPAHIAKDADMAETDLDPTVVLAEPTEGPTGNAGIPGSPAWEAIDAATARKWTSILSRAKTALTVMEDRELIEAATVGELGDYDAALDLNSAACAIDYAISVLAPFAVDEQAEVDAADLEAVGKAVTGLAPDALDVIEALTQVTKAGRALSAANEAAIRGAVESLQKVLTSLPAAPDPQEGGLPVAKKETAMDTPEAPAAAETPTTDMAETVVKEGDGKPPMVAVYDAKGKLVGIVDPVEITPISGVDAGDEEPEAPAADPADLEPAPAGEVGTAAGEELAKVADAAGEELAKVADAAGEELAKAADLVENPATDVDTDDVAKGDPADTYVLKSSLTELVKGLVDEHSATHTAQLTKTGEAIVELAALVETLKSQVRTLEEQPAAPGVFANGAIPPAHMMRGQDAGAPPVDAGRARELKKAMYSGTAPEQNAAAVQMQTAAIDALKAIHRGA